MFFIFIRDYLNHWVNKIKIFAKELSKALASFVRQMMKNRFVFEAGKLGVEINLDFQGGL